MTEGEEWVVGIHAVTELLRQQPRSVQRLLVQKGRHDPRIEQLKQLASTHGIASETLAKNLMDKDPGGVHQGIAAYVAYTNIKKDQKFLDQLLDSLDHDPLLLVLDSISDPHNLGACLRTADAAGVDAVIVPKDKSAPMNMTVRKVASGAAETVNFVVVTNLKRSLESLKERGIWLIGTADEVDKTVYEQDLTGPLALVMGSEGKGLRRLTRQICDHLVAIPMAGVLSSLNVSVATGVCLFEAARQRQD